MNGLKRRHFPSHKLFAISDMSKSPIRPRLCQTMRRILTEITRRTLHEFRETEKKSKKKFSKYFYSRSFIEYFWSKVVTNLDAKWVVFQPSSVCCCSTASGPSLLALHTILKGWFFLKCLISWMFCISLFIIWNVCSFSSSHFHSFVFLSRGLSGAHRFARFGMNLLI